MKKQSLSDSELALMHGLLAGPGHGYDLLHKVCLGRSATYYGLRKLRGRGLVKLRIEEFREHAPVRHLYSLTRKGRFYLQQQERAEAWRSGFGRNSVSNPVHGSY